MLCTSCKCRTESSLGRAENNYSDGGLRFFLLLTLLLSVSTTLLASEKLNERVIDFHIPQQALSSALIELAEQADLTLIFPDQLVEGKRSNAISGLSTPRKAINKVLAGTGLAVEFSTHSFHTIKIMREGKIMKNKTKIGSHAELVASFAGDTLAQSNADSATSGTRRGTIEEVIVTATKRSTVAQDTAIALTAVSGDKLRDAGVANIEDLGALSPSTSAALINGQFAVTIRGVGNELLTGGTAEAGVAMHTNGVYTGTLRTTGSAFFDVDRIEILRGPQGTLWGRNSTGGAINVIQTRPSEEFDGYIDASYGRFNTYHLEGALNGAISDNIQARISGRQVKSDGFLENLSRSEDLGDKDSQAVRASFNIDISDSTSWLLAAGYSEHDINGYPSKQEGTAFPLGVVNPITALAGSPLDGSLSFAEVEFSPAAERGKFEVFQTNPDVFDKLKSHYFTSELNFKIGSVDVVLLSDYREFDYASLKDVDNVNTFLTEGSTVFDEFGEEFSHELRFSGSSNTLQWLAGAFVFRSDLTSETQAFAGPYSSVPDTLTGNFSFFPRIETALGGDLYTDAWAVFGEATLELTDRWSIVMGLRYSDDEKETDEIRALSINPGDGLLTLISCPSAVCPFTTNFKDSWNDVTGRFGLQFRPSDDVLVFSQIAKGFKSGGINLGAQTGPFDAETLLSYELGIKSSFLEQRGQLNATMFYSDFENYQLQSILGTALVITSGDADITGLELESRYLTSETVSVGLMASWNNSEITDYSGALINPATLALVQTGEPLPRTPESSYRVDIQKDFQLSSGRLISTGAAYTWQDDANLDPFGTFGADQSDYGLLDAYIRLSELDDRWSLDLFGKNLTDEFYKQSAFLSAAALGSAVNANIGERRTYGLRFRAQY